MADIDITHEDRISTIIMSDRERKDTLSSEVCGTMAERLCERARARSVQWVVVAGEGGAFCLRTDLASEMDVASPAKAREGELIQRTNTTSSAGACL
jgi:enoyl-CoA hydratase/carnithine racemase